MHIYDVVIVGLGAAGGTLSAHLAQKGADVAVVEGGPRVNTRTDFNLAWPAAICVGLAPADLRRWR